MGPMGPQGLQGPLGLGLSFVIKQIPTESPNLALPPGNSSVVYLVTTGPANVRIVLPLATSGQNRLITIRRVDGGRRVFVQARPGESIDGDTDPIVMRDRGDYITIVSNGATWAVIAQQR